jgi:hypothetical protein
MLKLNRKQVNAMSDEHTDDFFLKRRFYMATFDTPQGQVSGRIIDASEGNVLVQTTGAKTTTISIKVSSITNFTVDGYRG